MGHESEEVEGPSQHRHRKKSVHFMPRYVAHTPQDIAINFPNEEESAH